MLIALHHTSKTDIRFKSLGLTVCQVPANVWSTYSSNLSRFTFFPNDINTHARKCNMREDSVFCMRHYVYIQLNQGQERQITHIAFTRTALLLQKLLCYHFGTFCCIMLFLSENYKNQYFLQTFCLVLKKKTPFIRQHVLQE